MYLNFYNLKKEPFHITPDPEFLFLCQSNRQAFGAIIWGVSQKKGFIAVTGDVGVGKTTILRYYLETVDRQLLKIIYLFNANVSFPGLLKTIYKELGLESGTDDMVEMVNHLHEILIEEYKQGRSVLLIIDEAQNMPVETLENLRMLSNLETSTDKLIQIVLIGQSEFEEKLNQNELRQLNQRIAIRSRILPLTEKESI
ncbi:MAG: AAA family ATPase, partial [Deltaproteobacteria bacterium]|nr:AAA family ATPase [Deltaproteobacteria bacterium]